MPREPTPDELEREADAFAEAGYRAKDAGNVEEALRLFVRARIARRLAEGMRREEVTGLQPPNQSGKVSGMMDAARLRISKGRREAKRTTDPLVKAANDAGYTLRSLAEKVGVSHAMLYQARRGTVAIRESWAKEIERLTGFAATKAHWPRGWASE